MKRSASGRLRPLLLITALGLVACGGGDGDSGGTGGNLSYTGPTAAVQLDAGSIGRISDEAWSNVDTMQFDAGSVIGSGATAVQLQSGMQAADLPAAPDLGRRVKRAVKLLAKFNSLGTVPSAAIVSQTLDCSVSGTITMTANQAVQNTITVGDRYEIRFSACNDGLSVTDGSMVMNVDQFTGDASLMSNFSIAGRLSIDLQNRLLGSNETSRMGGSLSFEQSRAGTLDTSHVFGTRIVMIGGAKQLQLGNFDFRDTYDSAIPQRTYGADFTLSSTTIGGSITVETLSDFQSMGYSFYPTAGTLRITCAAGAWVQLDAQSDGQYQPTEDYVTLSWDIDADGTADGSKTVLWSDLPNTTIP